MERIRTRRRQSVEKKIIIIKKVCSYVGVWAKNVHRGRHVMLPVQYFHSWQALYLDYIMFIDLQIQMTYVHVYVFVQANLSMRWWRLILTGHLPWTWVTISTVACCFHETEVQLSIATQCIFVRSPQDNMSNAFKDVLKYLIGITPKGAWIAQLLARSTSNPKGSGSSPGRDARALYWERP
jgi:hypothetical protein